MRRVLVIILLAGFAVAAADAKPSDKKKSGKDAPKEVALYNEGVGFLKRARYAEAQAKFEAAIAENKSFAEAHNNLGYVLRKQDEKNYAAALTHYDKAIKLNKKLAQAYSYRGALHVLMGNKAKAEADYEVLKDLDKKLASELRHVIKTGRESSAKERIGIVGEHGW